MRCGVISILVSEIFEPAEFSLKLNKTLAE